MSKNKPKPVELTEATRAQLARWMPTNRAEFLAMCAQTVARFNAAVLGADMDEAYHQADVYESAIWLFNGRTSMGCYDICDDDSPGKIIDRHCAAEPGEKPTWGQIGEFLITVDYVRVLVEVATWSGHLIQPHVSFRAVDLDGPFVSPSGYQHHYVKSPVWGKTLHESVTEFFAKALRETAKKKVWIDDHHKQFHRSLPDWVTEQLVPAPRREVPCKCKS